ncbi:13152_t:CDS:1, partial [Cetraspora pellucida]
GYIWEATPQNVIIHKSWYSFCQKYKCEKLCCEIVMQYLGPPSRIHRPDFLKTHEYPTGLELNIPYYKYGFAIEVQGQQHKYYVKHFYRSLEGFNNMLA